jgi:hypothetical protein
MATLQQSENETEPGLAARAGTYKDDWQFPDETV